jgi:CubicO group peptidase (beta-lactamase class C family)
VDIRQAAPRSGHPAGLGRFFGVAVVVNFEGASPHGRGATQRAGSTGEFGWSGAAKTYYWVDPREQVVVLFMTQSMMGFDLPDFDLRALAYQAIED